MKRELASRLVHSALTTTRRGRLQLSCVDQSKTSVCLRDERPHAGSTPPACGTATPRVARASIAARNSPPSSAGCTPTGFGKLYEIAGAGSAHVLLLQGPPRVAEVACWAHVRCGFFDEYASYKSAIAKEALDRIGALFGIERTITGRPPDIRRAVRQPRDLGLMSWRPGSTRS